MAKTQPKIDDIKDLKKATDTSDGLMSKEDKMKLDGLDYGDLGDMPVATDTEVGGIKIGYDNILSASPEALPLQVDAGVTANKDKAFVVLHGTKIKELLGVSNSDNYNSEDIFISGLPTPETIPANDFNAIVSIGSYKVNGTYSNAPNQNCGTSTADTVVRGSLNVFRSGVNDWETIQQLFWVLNGKTEQYQRSYDGIGGTGWTDWKRLIKCDDYATLGRGGIISSTNLVELFRAPDLIQLWNDDTLSLEGGNTYYLDTLSIMVTTQNLIDLDGTDIRGLTSERRYRVTYEVHYEKVEEGEGEVTIRIYDRSVELYSVTDYMHDFEIRKRTTFSVILTNIENVTPSIEVGSELNISIFPHYYQVSVEEIKFPLFIPV